MIVVIRAGGTGTRLWPISRKSNPKQFAQLTGETSLIKHTVARVLGLVGEPKNIFISVNQDHVERLLEEVPEIPRKNIIVEPCGRNTGPAICLETVYLKDRGVEDSEVVATICSDDFIGEPATWRAMLEASETFLQSHPEMIITPGAKPDYLDTGFSFLKAGQLIDQQGEIQFTPVEDWIEKPSVETGKSLLENNDVYYHMGTYIWTLGTAAASLEERAGHVMNVCREVVNSDDPSETKKKYGSLPKESIETLLTKTAPSLVMATAPSMGWSDIGKWHVLKRVLPSNDEQNITKGKVYAEDTKNSLLYAPEGKLVAVIGMDNVIVVDTGDALLVANADQSGDVKKIVEKLESEGRTDLL